MTKDETLRLALEALNRGESKLRWAAIAAIEEALATDYRAVKTYHEGKPVYVSQPEQKPYGWIDVYGHFWNHKTSEDDVPLYTTPPKREWVELTDEAITEVEDEFIVDYRIPAGSAWNFARAVEAKSKELNT
jgi:hypothetical protein